MTYHRIITCPVARPELVDAVTDILFAQGCSLGNSESTEAEDSLSLAFAERACHTTIKVSDPFFRGTQLFESPNEFYIPLSSSLPGSRVLVLDLDESECLQYWLYHRGSCVDQYHSQRHHLPDKEQEELRGEPRALQAMFPDTGLDGWKEWLQSKAGSEQRLHAFLGLAHVADPETGTTGTPNTRATDSLVFHLPTQGQHHPKPRHLFPWLLVAAPAAYFSVRYAMEPNIDVEPTTPSDNNHLDEAHQIMLERGMEYHGDFTISLAAHARVFARLYYLPANGTHLAISRTETPMEAFWQTDVTSRFADRSKLTTTNAPFDVPFAIPHRVVRNEPHLWRVQDLLEAHTRHVEESGKRPINESYTTDRYLKQLQDDMQRDYEALRDAGYLRVTGTREYALSWRGAFRMLHHQWKTARQHST